MENGNEILSVELTLESGKVHKMNVQEVESYDWDKIEKGTVGVLNLVGGPVYLVVIQEADSNGLSFTISGDSRFLYYDFTQIASLFVHVK